MYCKLRLFELEHIKFKIKTFFFSKNKVRFLEMVKFRFLTNFRFLTLYFLHKLFIFVFYLIYVTFPKYKN